MTKDDVRREIRNLAIGGNSARIEDMVTRAVNLGLELAAQSLSGPGGDNDYLYTGSPELGYMRQRKLAEEIRGLKIP